ncbi:MAG: penicillin-binding protein activator [Thiotrichales bacterium]|nr:penicillin-binding protein activator [Thiotrichales bacterium]
MKSILLVTISLGVLVACGTQQPRETDEAVVSEAAALRLVEDGRYGEAAREYVALARDTEGALAHDLMLRAVALLLEIGRTDDASALLDELSEQTLAEDLAPRRNLLAADLALRQREPDRTIELLSAFPAERFGPESVAKLHLLRARAYEDTGRLMDAAQARVRLDAALSGATRRAANHSALWEALIRTDRTERERALAVATGPLIGWLRLAEVLDEHRSTPVALGRTLSRWRGEFPDHPANAEIVTAMLAALRTSVRRPTRIALLLPFHGDFADAADATRDGFLAAWYADAANVQRPAIAVHDTSFEAIDVVYTRAVEAGADFVVGPLRRGSVTSLACGDTPLVTTLALNEIDDLPASEDEPDDRCGPDRTVPALYHFTLLPEAEARQVAERAWIGGHSKAVAFAREGPWGTRVYRAFVDEWERLGGTLLDGRVLARDATDTGQVAAGALGILGSRERARELGRIVGRKLEFEPRRRQDIDIVFMAAFPADARQLMPHLAFHHGADLPVHATSHVWSGVPDPANDRDLDGVVFGDMPWLAAPTESDRRLREQIETALGGGDLTLRRLYAFGADAYRLATRLWRLTDERLASVDGHTGRLAMAANHRISRRLTWARFVDGIPVPREPEGVNVGRSKPSPIR